ncbi:hypothetical protein BDR22DRAFT_827072 [Usnea florida]
MAPTTGPKGLKAKKVARLKQTNDAGVHKPPKLRHRLGYVHVPPLISPSVSESSTVSEASFSSLPPELKIQIFGYLDSVSAVTALSSTSRTFNSIWKVNTKHICDAIVQRTVESPVEAKALIDAQQSTRKTKDKRSLKKVRRDQNGYQKVARRLQQYLTNDDMASLALSSFERKVLQGSEIRQRLPSTERGPFIQAYYRSRVLILLSTDGIPSSLITPWSMLEYRRVYEILDYFYYHAEYTQMDAIVSKEESEAVIEGSHDLFSKSEIALYRLELLEDDLSEDFPEIYPYDPDNQPLRFFTTYELDAKTTDELRSVPLADYLPRLPYSSLRAEVNLDHIRRRLEWLD